MAIKDAILPEFDHEIGTTRRLLERLPEDKLAWKPHAKSMSLGRLARHLGEIPQWGLSILNDSSFDLATGESNPEQFNRSVQSRQEALQLLEEAAAKVRTNLASKSDAELMATWSLKRGAQEILTVPRIAAIRSFVLNHLIHHRGQFSVYLRLNDVPLPPIYGPTADEGF